MKKGTCRLTNKVSELQQSHIYPKFVIDWMKSTGSKYLRRYTTPNRREQDGYKMYLLSREAEQLFSIKEKWFAENVFHKYLNNSFFEIKYNENLFYFSISFLWRIVVLELQSENITEFKYYDILKETEYQWREFLLNGIYPKDFDRIHLILGDKTVNHTLPSKNVDYFFTRSLDGTISFDYKNNRCSVFAKFSKFIFWAFINPNDEEGMQGTRISPINGTLKVPQNFNNPEILDFFLNRIKLYDNMSYASENQQEKIIDEILNNKEHYLNSELFDTLIHDKSMKFKNKYNSY